MRPIVLLIETPSPGPVSSLAPVVQLVSVVIWPLMLTVLLLTHRRAFSRLLTALAALAESANKIKVWEVEIERDIDSEVDKAAREAQKEASPKLTVGPTEVIAANRVETLVGRVPDSPSKESILGSVRLRMLALTAQYDKVRADMPPGRERTVEMNKIAAQMRALGIAAKPWLKIFSTDRHSAGVRLCAVAILQMAPSVRYLDWLAERFTSEQPFIFYQAAIALMEAVRKFGAKQSQKLQTVISSSLGQVKGFKNGTPDQNSINVLDVALAQLRSLSDETSYSQAQRNRDAGSNSAYSK